MPAPYLLTCPLRSPICCRPDGGRREAERRPTHRSYRSIALRTGFKLPQYLRSVSHKCRN